MSKNIKKGRMHYYV